MAVKGCKLIGAMEPAPQRNAPEKVFGECRSYKLPVAKVEAMLQAQFGKSLQPIRKDVEYPAAMQLKPGKVKALTIIEKKLRPKDLTACDLLKLVSDGKTLEEVAQMYSFNSRNYFLLKLRKIGCNYVLKRSKGAAT